MKAQGAGVVFPVPCQSSPCFRHESAFLRKDQKGTIMSNAKAATEPAVLPYKSQAMDAVVEPESWLYMSVRDSKHLIQPKPEP